MPRILIVEAGSPESSGLLDAVVGIGQVVVAEARSEEDALQCAARSRPDLALVDVELAGRMDGIELAQHLQVMYDVPVILVVTRSAPPPLELIEGARPYGYLLKPFTERDLRMAIDVVLQRRRVEREQIQQQRADAAIEERERLAAELHDNVCQLLSFVKLQAFSARELLARGDSAGADTLLEHIIDSAQEAQAELRQQIRDLYVRVAPEGFAAALQACARGFEIDGTGARLTLTLTPAVEQAALDPETSLQLTRIVQEALANVRKHAHAQHVKISFDIIDGLLTGLVQDDGRGFDEQSTEWIARRHFGLQIMRERARSIDGQLEVESSPGHGTRISIIVPLDRQAPAG